jgi:LysM repeat protein
MSFPSKLAIFGFILFSISISFAQAKDFVAMDSIGVQRVGDKTFIVHRIGEQETLFSISRRYKVSMGDIQGANEALKQGLKVGETILVPHSQAIAPITSPVVNATEVKAADTPTPAVTPTTSPASPSPASISETSTNTTIHKVTSGETLFAISNKYGVTVEELKVWNTLKGDKVTVGQSLKIQKSIALNDNSSSPTTPTASPVKKEEVKKEEKTVTKKEQVPADKKVSPSSPSTSTSSSEPGEWISHTVKANETLFSLSNKYGSTTDELTQWNALSSTTLRIGQSIKVGRMPASTTVVPIVGEAKTNTSSTTSAKSGSGTASKPSEATQETTSNTLPNTSGGFSNTKEMGLAELIPNTNGTKKYLVLHRTAPVGSVIRIKNEENDLTIFARVIGVLPETGDNGKLLIKLSQAAFDQLKAVNQRFPVEILY